MHRYASIQKHHILIYIYPPYYVNLDGMGVYFYMLQRCSEGYL
jgi:hypothetical protein